MKKPSHHSQPNLSTASASPSYIDTGASSVPTSPERRNDGNLSFFQDQRDDAEEKRENPEENEAEPNAAPSFPFAPHDSAATSEARQNHAPRQRSGGGIRLWLRKMIKIFEPLDFKDAKPKRPQHSYVVKHGDTLAGIALRHGMKEAEVRAMNNLWEGNVFTGQEIVLHRKRRSHSMPELLGAQHYTETLENQHASPGKEGESRKRVEFTSSVKDQTEEEPVADDESATAVSPLKSRSRSTLDVIQEQQPLMGFFSALFGSSSSSSSSSVGTESNNMKEQPQLKDLKATKSKPRLKTRSYSERLPTNQEEQDDVYGLPKLIGASDTDVLSDARHGPKLVPKIEAFLPMRLRGYDWTLLYSLAQHGSSLHTLMRKVRGQRATLVVVETCKGDVFGGFVPATWTNSLSYYGSGESFVFTTVPSFEVFAWKRTNTMFMYSNDNSIAMGGGGGFAWFMNSDLSHGTTSECETFGNRPLTSDPDFDIAHVEVWGFAMF